MLNEQSILQQALDAHRSGNYPIAINNYKEVLSLNPKNSDAWHLLGKVLINLNLSEAISCLQQAINCNPKISGFYASLGEALLRNNQLVPAQEALKHSLAIHFNLPSAKNLVVTLSNLGEKQEAYKLANEYWQLTKDLEFAIMAGTCLLELNVLDEAIAILEQYKNHEYAKINLKQAYFSNKQYQESLQLSNFTNLELQKKAQVIDTLIATYTANYQKTPVIPDIILPIFDSLVLSQSEAVYQENGIKFYNHLGGKNKKPYIRKNKIHIGYLSGDFNNHPISLFTLDLFNHHNSAEFNFYLINTHNLEDDISQRYKNMYQERMVAIKDLPKLDLDIVVDLSAHTKYHNNQLINQRIAHLQVHWLGYPASTFIPNMDGYISTKNITTEPSYFSEQLLYLPEPIATISPSLLNNNYQLPSKKKNFGYFGKAYRISKHICTLWFKILQLEPDSNLYLMPEHPLAQQNILKYAQEFKVAQQIVFIPKALLSTGEVFNHIKVWADTFPFASGTSAFLSLYYQTPVVTYQGNRSYSRLPSALLNYCNLAQCIAYDETSYINKIRYLLHNDLEFNCTELLTAQQQTINNLERLLKDKLYANK